MLKLLYFALLALLIVVPVMAQDAACETLLNAALSRTLLACAELEDGEICYGNPSVTAVANAGASLNFTNMGDRAAIDDVASLSLSAADSGEETWGTVVLRQGAVTKVIFGGAIFDPATGRFTASGEADCGNTPPQIMLFSSDESSVSINGVGITFKGIMLLTLDADGTLRVRLLGGTAGVTAADETVTLENGTMTGILLDEDGLAAETPSDALEYVREDVNPYFSLYTFMGEEDYPLPVPAAGEILPGSGRWQLMLTSTYQYTACLVETLGAPENRINQTPSQETIVEFDFSEGISIQIFLEQQIGSTPPDAVYINPIPNLYKAFAYRRIPPIEFWLTVVSETEIVTATIYYVDEDREPGSCGIISFNYWERIG